MAPTFKHGKGTRILVNQYNLSTMLDDFSMNSEVNTAECTPYGNNDRKYVPGVRSGSISFGGMFDGGTDHTQAVLESALGSSTDLVTSVGFDDSTGGRCRLFKAVETSFEVTSPVDDVVSVQGAMDANERVGYGRWLRPWGTAATTTGSGSSVDSSPETGSTAGSTRGGAAHLHITSASTLTSVTIKVQHSSNGSAWADLISFTASTAARVQRSTVAGSVKRYTRETRSAFTGGAGKSITHAVAFARYRNA